MTSNGYSDKKNKSTNRTAAIVTSVSDVERVAKSSGAFIFLCVNSTLLNYCRERMLKACLLDDEEFSDQFEDMTQWGFETTSSFCKLFRKDRGINFLLLSNQLYFQSLFLQTLKYVLYFENKLDTTDFDELLLINDPTFLMGIVGQEYYSARGGIKLRFLQKNSPANSRQKLKEHLRQPLSRIMTFFERIKFRGIQIGQKPWIAVSGGLNHLSGVLEQMQAVEKIEIIVFENSFNLEKWRYCRRHGFIFMIIPAGAPVQMSSEFSSDCFRDFPIHYRGKDYTRIFQNVFSRFLCSAPPIPAFQDQMLQTVLSVDNMRAVILDEDFVERRVVYAVCKRLDKPCFVISHGIPGIYLSKKIIESLRGAHESALTFVNSRFEKESYERFCYDASRILLEGIPRYDRLVRLKNITQVSRVGKKRRLTILYCGSGMKDFDFRLQLPWMGVNYYAGDQARIYTKDLLEVLEVHPDVNLKIKPHYNDEDDWRNFLKPWSKKKFRYKILSHQDDVFRLEAEADVIVTPESSVICEAIMLDKPVIVLNYTKKPLMTPYKEPGIIECVHNKEELAGAISKCLYDREYLARLSLLRRKHFQFYAGFFYGKNSLRVAQSIVRNFKPLANV